MGPRLFRPATWFDGSGIVALIPLRRDASRIFRVEYALSASTRSGLVLGVPPELLVIEMSAITGGEGHRIVPLPGCGHPGDRAALRVRHQVDLRGHPTPATPQTLPIRDRCGLLVGIRVIRPIPPCS